MRSKLDAVQPAIHAAVRPLDADLSLGALATVAGVSPLQFHRTFSAVVGETPKRFAARLRVERAAGALMDLTIELRDLPAQPALFVKRRIRRADIAKTIGAALPVVFKHSQRVGGAMASAPMARYSEMGPGMLTIETGFIVATPVPGDGEVEAVTLPAGQAACATHVGPYDTLQQTHSAWRFGSRNTA